MYIGKVPQPLVNIGKAPVRDVMNLSYNKANVIEWDGISEDSIRKIFLSINEDKSMSLPLKERIANYKKSESGQGSLKISIPRLYGMRHTCRHHEVHVAEHDIPRFEAMGYVLTGDVIEE